MTDVKTVGEVSWYEEERPRLVRLCGAITGQPESAEDLGSISHD